MHLWVGVGGWSVWWWPEGRDVCCAPVVCSVLLVAGSCVVCVYCVSSEEFDVGMIGLAAGSVCICNWWVGIGVVLWVSCFFCRGCRELLLVAVLVHKGCIGVWVSLFRCWLWLVCQCQCVDVQCGLWGVGSCVSALGVCGICLRCLNLGLAAGSVCSYG